MLRKSGASSKLRRAVTTGSSAGACHRAGHFGPDPLADDDRNADDDRTRGRLMFFEGFTKTEIKTSGARIVTVHGGKGPPLLLLHGNPFSHLSWQKFAPRLAQEFTVVATDLRGYGGSQKPPGGKNHENYSFRAMAQDQVEVMETLGYSKFFAAGHDRGARVLHRMCLDHPDEGARVAILDIIPQHHLLNNVTRQ